MTLAGSFTVSICFSSTEKSMVTTPVFTSLPMTVFSLERSISSIVAVVLLTVESTRIVFSSPDTGTVTEVEGVVLPPELPLPVPPDVPPELLPPVLLPPLEPLSFSGWFCRQRAWYRSPCSRCRLCSPLCWWLPLRCRVPQCRRCGWSYPWRRKLCYRQRILPSSGK